MIPAEGCRVPFCDHLARVGGAVWSADWWQLSDGGASGSGGFRALVDYVARALSGELRNVATWQAGTDYEHGSAEVYALDWSHAP